MKTEAFVTDVLVIGSGIAGMLAALEARKAGADVTIASKAALGKESSTSHASHFRVHPEDPARVRNIKGYDDKPGKYIEDSRLVRTLFDEAPRQIENLISFGVPMVMIPLPGTSDKAQGWRVKGSEHIHGGTILLDILVAVARKMGIRAVENCSMISLLKHDDSVVGASGLLRAGSWLSVYAKAVVLATGGGGGMSEVTTTPREVAGNGYAMALKAGLPLQSMEFNTFYSVGLPTPGGRYVQCHPAVLTMKNALLRNEKGEDIVKKHIGVSLQEAMPPSGIRFDWLARVVAAELEEGNVLVDLTRVPLEAWDKMSEKDWKQIRQTQVDMKQTPLSILPMSHYFGSGLTVDTSMKTELKGLYAAGEVVAGRRVEGGISNLPGCLAMGAIAGRSAAAGIEGVKAPSQDAKDDGLHLALAMLEKSGRAKPVEVGDEIRRIVYRHDGPIKSRDSLEAGLKKLDLVGKLSTELRCQDMQDLRDALETRAMLLTSRSMLQSALLRTDSRGGFFRRDFPRRDDANWLRPVVASYEPESGEVKVAPGEPLALDTA